MDKYLTPKLKECYMVDFINNVLTCVDPLWRLDDRLSEILIEINKNKNLQTLYSKWWRLSSESSIFEGSYLEFCYTKQIESKIFNHLIPEIINYFKTRGVVVECTKCEPGRNFNFHRDPKSEIKLYCVTRPNYYWIKRIRLEITASDSAIYSDFWSYLKQKLAEV